MEVQDYKERPRHRDHCRLKTVPCNAQYSMTDIRDDAFG